MFLDYDDVVSLGDRSGCAGQADGTWWCAGLGLGHAIAGVDPSIFEPKLAYRPPGRTRYGGAPGGGRAGAPALRRRRASGTEAGGGRSLTKHPG